MIETAPATALLIAITFVVVALSTRWPVVESSLEARADVLASGQWWRLFTLPPMAGTKARSV